MTALEGITVVSLEHAVAAPLATRHLADLGARVIKIERPDTGDFARAYDTSVRGLSSHFVWLNRSKESVALDLKDDFGRAVLEKLLALTDVFVQNLAPGAADRLGLGTATLRKRRPGMICCSISGYGSSGSWASRRAYDLLIQCEAGVLSVTGTESEPAKVGIPVADIAAGMYSFSSILAALFRRGRTGDGATIEISMLEALGEWMGFPAYFTEYGGSAPRRTGARHAAIAPYGPFAVAGGRVIFLAIQNEREWARFCSEVLRRPELAADARFCDNTARVANRDELESLIGAEMATIDAETAVAQLEQVGIATARLNTLSDFIAHPQLEERGRWRQIVSPVGSLRALVPPLVLDGEMPVMGPVPALGQHTSAVLAELGLRPAAKAAV